MKDIVVFTNNLYLFGKYSKRENKHKDTFYYSTTDKIFLFYRESRWYFSKILFNCENFITQSKECNQDKCILFVEWISDIKIKKYVENENTEKDDSDVFNDNFPNDLGDFENIVAKDNIRWEKLSNITKFSNLPISLYQSMESTDVKQGLLGNCWLISALGCISKYPSFLKNITFKEENNLNQIQDIYQITLYNFWKKKWEKIRVNQYVPVFQKGLINIPLFSRNTDHNEIYLSILEKAFAKLARGYGNLISGNPGMAFITLTGCETVECYLKNSKDNFRKFEYNIEDMRKNPRSFQYTRFKGFNVIYAENEFYEYLKQCFENNNLITCGINSEEKRMDGLINHHSYSVIDLTVVGDFRVITLQDPHGFNNTSFIPEKIFEKLEEKELTGNFSFENENCIYMEFQDFYRIFSCVQICKVDILSINSPTQDSTHRPP